MPAMKQRPLAPMERSYLHKVSSQGTPLPSSSSLLSGQCMSCNASSQEATCAQWVLPLQRARNAGISTVGAGAPAMGISGFLATPSAGMSGFFFEKENSERIFAIIPPDAGFSGAIGCAGLAAPTGCAGADAFAAAAFSPPAASVGLGLLGKIFLGASISSLPVAEHILSL